MEDGVASFLMERVQYKKKRKVSGLAELKCICRSSMVSVTEVKMQFILLLHVINKHHGNVTI
jgi:hypothetical protein